MKLTFFEAKREKHPDLPTIGWTVEVHDSNGVLVARFYGPSERVANARAALFTEGLVRLGRGDDVEVKP